MSATKEQPKEMLPVFAKGSDGRIHIKPLVQMVFEQLFDYGVREYCFIVGRGKRAIEDHFTPDYSYVDKLNSVGKNGLANYLQLFYTKLERSNIVWVNQPQPRGFGDAVLQSRTFAGTDMFVVYAGDTYILSQNNSHLTRLVQHHTRAESAATLLAQEVPDPRQYGVIESEPLGGELMVIRATEKPELPATNLAIMPVYIFTSDIFKALETTPPGKGGELQLTDAIQKLIEWGMRVSAVKLYENDLRLDIGTPETYYEAQVLSYRQASLP